MKQKLPTQPELTQLACLMVERGNAAPKELISRAFEIWKEAGALLAQAEQMPELIESEGAERWLDEHLNRSIPISGVAKRGLLPSFRTSTGNLKSTKRVRQVLVDYQRHLKAQVADTTCNSEERAGAESDLAELAGALKSGTVRNQLLQRVKRHLEQERNRTATIRAEGKSLPSSSVPECRKPEHLIEPLTRSAEHDNEKGSARRKR